MTFRKELGVSLKMHVFKIVLSRVFVYVPQGQRWRVIVSTDNNHTCHLANCPIDLLIPFQILLPTNFYSETKILYITLCHCFVFI